MGSHVFLLHAVRGVRVVFAGYRVRIIGASFRQRSQAARAVDTGQRAAIRSEGLMR